MWGIKFFIGNSATYFFDIPTKFMYIAESVGIEIDVTYCTVGGAFLSEFADPNDETHGVALRNQLAAKKFDNIDDDIEIKSCFSVWG